MRLATLLTKGSLPWLLLGVLLGQPVFANTAEDYFEDGNRLFRNDLYWAALLRYREAREAGLDTPLLDYNTGVAHYKAGQHNRARESFRRSARSTQLAVLSHYNLGLNAYKLGKPEEALRWFRRVRDQQQNERLAALSRRAIQRIRNEERDSDPVAQRAERQRAEEKRSFTDLDVRASVGFGNDDNVYRSPANDYIDFAQAGNPLVTPTVTTGAYLPVDLKLRYNINSLPFEGFYTAYKFRGHFYQDKELDNANEFVHEVSFGNEYRRTQNGITREVYSAFKMGQADETYFDPDNGDVRIVDGIDIGERLNYRRYGPELKVRQSGERLAIGAMFEGQLLNYEDVDVVPEYDHEYLKLGLHAQYKFTPGSLARLTLEGFSRHYGDRPSFDLDGQQRLGNPDVEYDYLNVSLLARQRVTDSMWFGIEYERTDRTDGYVGYFDYTRDAFKAEFHWSPGRRFVIDAYARYSLYDYPNAFAFNNDARNRRTLEVGSARLRARWRLTESLSLVGSLRHRETVSNDARIQYDRNLFSLSVRWDH